MRDQIKAVLGRIGMKPLLLAAGLIGIVLLLIGSFGDGCTATADETSGEGDLEEYRETLTREAETICRRVEGAGEVHIMLTLETGEVYTYTGSHMTSSSPPRVLGVAVVAEGAGSDTVRAELTRLLSALFHVGANRIHISPAT